MAKRFGLNALDRESENMKYEVHMTVSIAVVVNAPDENVAEDVAVKRFEKRFDVKDMFIAGGCAVDTVEPAAVTLEDKRRKAEEAWAKLTRDSCSFRDLKRDTE